jgi:EmrB/QacA subfamily drug resistance transporter
VKRAETSLRPADAVAPVEALPRYPSVVLATCCLSVFLVTMDTTIVNVALPAIRHDLLASVSELQWAIDGYTVVIASFLILAGSTADRLGRRRVFQIGLALFSLGSLLCSLAPTTLVLVLCRVVQALGGSMLNPVAMSIIANTFPDPKARARAIGVWGAVVGVSMGIGPLLGGLLTQTVGWRSIFWVNVPVGLAAIVLAARFVPESRAEIARRVDPIGQTMIVVALGVLTSALIEGPHLGWHSPLIVGAFGLALSALIILVIYEDRRDEPLIDLRFFRSIPFSAATLVAVLSFSAFAGLLFLGSLYLQEARGLSAFDAGLCLMPTALAMVVCSPLSGRLVGAGRARVAIVIAGASMALSALLLTHLRLDTSVEQLVLAYTMFGVGLGMVNAPITSAAVSGMPNEQAGLASALASTSRQVGATLGVAIGGSIAGGGEVLGGAFAISTHPFWWLIVGCGFGIVALGIASTGARAQVSVSQVASLLGNTGDGAANLPSAAG